MRQWHKIIIERDNNACVYCGHPAETDSGELCGNHNPTQAARPELVFDISLHECVCKTCNQKHSYTAPREVKKEVAKPKKFKKPPVCAVPGCPIYATGTGSKPKNCFKHQ